MSPQRQSDAIEAERARTGTTYSTITATQERCRLADGDGGAASVNDAQLMGQANKGEGLLHSHELNTQHHDSAQHATDVVTTFANAHVTVLLTDQLNKS